MAQRSDLAIASQMQELHTMMTELSHVLGLELRYDQHNDNHYMIIALRHDRIMITTNTSHIIARYMYDVNTSVKLYNIADMTQLLSQHTGAVIIGIIINDLNVMRLLSDQRYD